MSRWLDFVEAAQILKLKFRYTAKRVLKKNVSKNPLTLRKNLVLISETYNTYVAFLNDHLEEFDLNCQEKIRVAFLEAKNNLIKSFSKFNKVYDISIELNTIIEINRFKNIKESPEIINLLF